MIAGIVGQSGVLRRTQATLTHDEFEARLRSLGFCRTTTGCSTPISRML
jgi:hypothetical protein